MRIVETTGRPSYLLAEVASICIWYKWAVSWFCFLVVLLLLQWPFLFYSLMVIDCLECICIEAVKWMASKDQIALYNHVYRLGIHLLLRKERVWTHSFQWTRPTGRKTKEPLSLSLRNRYDPCPSHAIDSFSPRPRILPRRDGHNRPLGSNRHVDQSFGPVGGPIDNHLPLSTSVQ